ncbi:uncharacterized protein LOC141601080 [Silene latifolia]|uniref:uncharacterized protein LOC141601080 n=1 Tax=Silene latifolia TaxID=37657 RepID=UPI003D778332
MIEQAHLIRQKMKAVQDRQKSYAILHRRDIEFKADDKVLLKLSRMRGVMRFAKRGKLSQTFIGPYVLDGIGKEVGDNVQLKVSPMQEVMRFGKIDKLRQKSIGSYDIFDRIEKVVYRLALSSTLDRVHNVFHMSQLRKYVIYPTHVVEAETIELYDALTYVELPKEIIDRKVRKTKNKETTLILKVIWSKDNVKEAT